jgi:hypothetical protein
MSPKTAQLSECILLGINALQLSKSVCQRSLFSVIKYAALHVSAVNSHLQVRQKYI